jgi:hypothetical protein
MTELHPKLLAKVFKIKLAEGFAVKPSPSSVSRRFCLIQQGIEMTEWLTAEDMEDVLTHAVITGGEELVEKLLS